MDILNAFVFSLTLLYYIFLILSYRTMWTWENWCSHCVISPRPEGSPLPWSRPGISKPWTSQELQVGAAMPGLVFLNFNSSKQVIAAQSINILQFDIFISFLSRHIYNVGTSLLIDLGRCSKFKIVHKIQIWGLELSIIDLMHVNANRCILFWLYSFSHLSFTYLNSRYTVWVEQP